MKKALVMSGGGSKGAFEVGVLKYLHENENVEYDIIAGVSVGALNASMLATGPMKETLPVLEKVWLKEIKGNSSVWKHYLLWYIIGCVIGTSALSVSTLISAMLGLHMALTIALAIITLASLFLPYYFVKKIRSVNRTGPLRKIVKKYLDLEKLKSSGKKLLVGAVAYETGEYRYANETNPNIINWIMASSAFPVFFPLEKIDGLNWTDGGVTNVVPLYDVLENGATDVDIILTRTLGDTPESKFGIPSQIERTIDLMTREIVRNDIIFADKKIKIRIFEPEKMFSYSSLEFDPKHIRETYNAGLKVAEKIMKENPKC
jgi:NTE family protein